MLLSQLSEQMDCRLAQALSTLKQELRKGTRDPSYDGQPQPQLKQYISKVIKYEMDNMRTRAENHQKHEAMKARNPSTAGDLEKEDMKGAGKKILFSSLHNEAVSKIYSS